MAPNSKQLVPLHHGQTKSSKILNVLKYQYQKMTRLKKIVDGINTKVETLETKVKNNDAIVTEVEQSNQFISNGFEEQRKY